MRHNSQQSYSRNYHQNTIYDPRPQQTWQQSSRNHLRWFDCGGRSFHEEVTGSIPSYRLSLLLFYHSLLNQPMLFDHQSRIPDEVNLESIKPSFSKTGQFFRKRQLRTSTKRLFLLREVELEQLLPSNDHPLPGPFCTIGYISFRWPSIC